MSTSLSTWKPVAVAALLVLSGCGGGGDDPPAVTPQPATFAVSGSVSGLNGVAVLQNSGGDDKTISANGSFTFATAESTGTPYSVTVKTQPSNPAQTCVVANAAGLVNGAAVTSVTVTCTTNTYDVGGSVSGLTSSGLVLENNAGDDLAVTVGATGFAFPIQVASGGAYNITVKAQPTIPAETCVVSSASGTVGNAAVANAVVTCTVNTAFVCGTSENGTVVTHSADIAADETWAGAGTVHIVGSPIKILAPATVTVQKCAIVKLAAGAGIDVRGDTVGGGIAKLVSAGDDFTTGRVVFESIGGGTLPWGRLRGFNKNSIIELNNTLISGGGAVGGSQLNAVISMNGSSTLPDPTLKVNAVFISAPAGAGIYFSNAAFTRDSDSLLVADAIEPMIAMPAMALGSVPTNTFSANNMFTEVRVVENSNIFDNLTISTSLPIHFKTAGVHVGGLAPTFVQNVTLTVEAGVTLKFEGLAGPPMVVFGDQGQAMDKNAALVVHGTAGAPVLFTSGAASPAPGDWAGLWLATSNGSQIDHAIIEYAGGNAGIGPQNCGPFDPSINQRAAHTAALLVGDGTDQQYVPPAGLLTNSVFRNNGGNFAIDSVWEAAGFGPVLNATNVFGAGPKFCTQSNNLKPLGCFVSGVDQSGCLVP